jgi:FtsP/CotA-like multicopper oxidase with cupredoxin domain
MRYFISALLSLMLFFNVSAQTTKTIYTCPMHPEVQQAKPGKCPKCGMTLVPKKVAVKAPAKKQPTKPVKPAPTTATPKPAPKANTEVSSADKTGSARDTIYTCPIHPEVVSDKPGDCPKCGMHLVPKQKAEPPKSSAVYTCPMHPEVVSDKPGKCPKCGMDLVRKETDMSAEHDMNAHESEKDSFDFGNNLVYTPFKHFAIPVLQPTPASSTVAIGKIANKEGDITNKIIPAANSGIHLPAGATGAKTVIYHLYITDTTVNYSGRKRKAVAVNGQIPAPPLVFTLGDTALIYVHNNGDKPSAVHWHGVQLANRMDGVPNLTQLKIPPHTTHIYKFPVVQTGTYWYHSHFELQEQQGLYGALIFNKRTEPDIPTIPVVLSDWSDLKPETINRYLHNANDWFAIKKNTVQSYGEAIKAGAFGIKVKNEWLRMSAMDVSDVYYERFLMNGKPNSTLSNFKAGDQVRLRLINGGASSYFWIHFSGSKLKVIANDGNDVMPVEVDRLIIGVSETYDVIVTLPENKKYELVATPEDRTKFASMWLGSGEEVSAKKLGRLDYFAGMKMMNSMMKMNGDMKPMAMEMSLQKMDMNKVMYPEMQTGETTEDLHQHGATMNSGTMNGVTEKYSCPMHPEVVSDKPGKCPKCGMDLVKQKQADMPAKYSCPMHPEVVSDKPGKCPKCGMDLVKQKPTETQAKYSCPMHPEVVSDKPGKCPKCGMDLTLTNGDSSHEMATQNGITTLNYDMLQSPHNTELKQGNWRDLRFVLEGNMNRYVWTLDNKTVGESDKIIIKKGENLRIILHNNSMMRHPMHLHGHDFRTLNRYGKNSPLKNVIDILPMETDTLEFHASEDGDWFFHCHILYHMMSGMGRVFSYANSASNPEIANPAKANSNLKKDDRMFHFMVQNDFATNGNDGMLMYANTRWSFQGEWRAGYVAHHGYEIETHFGRYLGKMQWLLPYVGVDFRYRRGHSGEKNIFGQMSTKDSRQVFHAGIQYTLPMLLVADGSVDHTGNVRLQISREDIPITRRARAMFMVNSDREYMVGAKYIITRHLAPSVHYDVDMGWGVGVTVSY